MHHEGEEFVHGPEMQIVPGYLVFIVDDPQGLERLANIADALSNVTAKTVLLTAHPKGGAHEVVVPQVAPLLSAIPNLVFFPDDWARIAERETMGRSPVSPMPSPSKWRSRQKG